ncbi:MAG: dTDP-4-dehydrorhamnose reductase [Planctomycetota bacterium]|jgi:dTDP-4-dehydrorhamnose reductase
MSLTYAVVGAAGQVGREFARLLPPDRLVALTRDRIDVTDPASVDACLDGVTADVIVNLAAFHDVNGCVEQPDLAMRVNAVGPLHVARAAERTGRPVVFVSSDYVFGRDAVRATPYLEHDPVGPLNVYGASKVAGESLVRLTTDEHLVVRTASLFGLVTSRKGWTFPEMIVQRARAGEPLRVVDDQRMSPTYTLDLVRSIIELAEAGTRGTVHLTNAGECSWHEFATRTLALAGLDHPIEAVGSDAFPSAARRPCYSCLGTERLDEHAVSCGRPWQEALHEYLCEKGFAPRSVAEGPAR